MAEASHTVWTWERSTHPTTLHSCCFTLKPVNSQDKGHPACSNSRLLPHMSSLRQLPFKSHQRMSWRAAGDKNGRCDRMREEAHKGAFDSGAFVSPSFSSSHFYPLICSTRCGSSALFLSHMVLTPSGRMQTTVVPPGELPQGQEHKVRAASVSCHVTQPWAQSGRKRAFGLLCFSATKCNRYKINS